MQSKFETSFFCPPVQRLMAVLAMAVALAACSRDLPAQAAHAAQAQAQAAPETASPGDAVVRALPDFTQLVDHYGAAVVNVEVVEKPRSGGAQGLSPNDPFYDFFRRFGIPPPEQNGPRAPVRGAGSGFIVSAD